MRVQIITDIEGVSGIVTKSQASGSSSRYEESRKLLTEETNAAIRGAKAAGAKEIVVVDGHGAGEDWNGNSLVPDLLEADCEWVAHHTWGQYTEFLEQGCDATLLIGQHARAGTPDGVLCHTLSTIIWRNIWINDVLVGEIGILAALCGYYGCPVLLVTGDEACCWEAKELLGRQLTTVAVKRGFSRYSARQIPPVRARRLIEDGAKRSLQNLNAVAPYVVENPTCITVELDAIASRDHFRDRHGVEFVEPLKIVSRGENWLQAWKQIWV